jgi:branched-chain amino acid transport system permease protein
VAEHRSVAPRPAGRTENGGSGPPGDRSRFDLGLGRTRNAVWFVIVGALTAILALVPPTGGSLSFSFYLMLWITMATGLNIIAGFTGYMPLGYVAFYGVGAFTTAILTAKAGWLIVLALPMAGVGGVVLSLLFAKTLELRGIYFAIVSLALAIISRLVVANLPEEITGGSFGITLGAESEPVAAFYVMLLVMLAAILTATWLAQSRLGKALRAIRDDPEAAETLGVNVRRARLKAWMLSALFASLVGGVEAWYTNIIDPQTAFEFLISAKAVIYAIAGGLGTVTGPVAGAVVMVFLDDLIWQRFPVLNVFLLGLAIVLLVLFLPRGIVGTLIQLKPALRRYIL